MVTRNRRNTDPPRLGLINPDGPTEVIDQIVTPEVEKFLNKVSKLSNHTISSVVTVLLAVQCVNLGPLVKAPKKRRSP